jgi:hypothetical protein
MVVAPYVLIERLSRTSLLPQRGLHEVMLSGGLKAGWCIVGRKASIVRKRGHWQFTIPFPLWAQPEALREP